MPVLVAIKYPANGILYNAVYGALQLLAQIKCLLSNLFLIYDNIFVVFETVMIVYLNFYNLIIWGACQKYLPFSVV
jgi:hypothetical protein